jgi:hypothetical protein
MEAVATFIEYHADVYLAGYAACFTALVTVK